MSYQNGKLQLDLSPRAMLVYYRIILGLFVLAMLAYYVFGRNLSLQEFVMALSGLFGVDRILAGLFGGDTAPAVDSKPD